MIREIIQFSSDPEIRHRITFVPDYDIAVARTLYQGCDVWLNNPRRPLEACGTSGEKAALNGVLNLSILDGWWDEMFDGENGWAISSAEGYEDLKRRDTVEAGSLFDILERQVVPLYYDRFEGPVPRRWVRRIKSSLRSLGPQVVASRMVRDYVEQLYEPIAAQADALVGRGGTDAHRARALAAWKHRVVTAWDGVKIVSVETEAAITDLGSARHVDAVVELGTLAPEDVAVELLHGAVGPNDELVTPQRLSMAPADGSEGGAVRYSGAFACETAGRYGFTVRVVPSHSDLTTPLELGQIVWA
jgi:starch phosphorylase